MRAKSLYLIDNLLSLKSLFSLQIELMDEIHKMTKVLIAWFSCIFRVIVLTLKSWFVGVSGAKSLMLLRHLNPYKSRLFIDPYKPIPKSSGFLGAKCSDSSNDLAYLWNNFVNAKVFSSLEPCIKYWKLIQNNNQQHL